MHERFPSILIPKYLTLSVGKSLLRLNLRLNYFTIKLFPFRFKDYKFGFFLTLSKILFALSQYTRFFKSKLTSLLSSLIDLLKYNELVSSAKWCTLKDVIAWLRSFMYNKNRRGPWKEPWGIPKFISATSES